MGKTLSEIDELPATEYEIWKEYFSRAPYPDIRIQNSLATLTATLVNVMGGRRSKAEDFIPDPWKYYDHDPEDFHTDKDDITPVEFYNWFKGIATK